MLTPGRPRKYRREEAPPVLVSALTICGCCNALVKVTNSGRHGTLGSLEIVRSCECHDHPSVCPRCARGCCRCAPRPAEVAQAGMVLMWQTGPKVSAKSLLGFE